MRQGKIVRAVMSGAAVACGLGWAGQAMGQSRSTYNGNGASGFGGQIGNSTLTVTDGGATINFSLVAPPNGFNGNGLAIYLDTVAGGFNDTSTFTDTRDNGRTILSGVGSNSQGMPPSRTVATFAPGFGADYGIALEPGAFAGIFNLNPNADGSFPYVNSAGLDAKQTTPLTFSINKADVGLAMGAGTFAFEASLISTTAYRSNETIGTSQTFDNGNGAAPNAGYTGTTTFSQADTFTYAAPEPTSLALLGIVAAGPLAARRRRRA